MLEQQWEMVANPAWEGKEPPLKPITESLCHDHSHFLTVACRCGEQMHMHESATKKLSPFDGVMSECKSCGELLVFQPGFFKRSFREMRERGWII